MSERFSLVRRLLAWPASGLRWLLLAAIRAYQFLLSPWLGNHCRFLPSCSNYAYEAIERHGPLAGSYLATRRLLRCHPWCAGGADPVPAERPRFFAVSGEPRPVRALHRSADARTPVDAGSPPKGLPAADPAESHEPPVPGSATSSQ